MVFAACGSEPGPASPTAAPGSSANPSASGGSPSPTPLVAVTPTPTPVLPGATVKTFWSRVTLGVNRSGRLRLIAVRPDQLELRYEPAASSSLVGGTMQSVCLSGKWYDINGFHSTVIGGKWVCGTSGLITAFRRSGQPLEAWNSTMLTNSRIKEVVTVEGKQWRWTYTASSKELGGTVKTTLVLDPITGRLQGGNRVDPRGTTRYTFSYTTIFAPIQLP